MTKEKECYILTSRKLGWNGKQYRQVKCYCGKVIALNGLGGHLYHKHNKTKKSEVIII